MLHFVIFFGDHDASGVNQRWHGCLWQYRHTILALSLLQLHHRMIQSNIVYVKIPQLLVKVQIDLAIYQKRARFAPSAHRGTAMDRSAG
jgi:hypothetical protein